MRCGAWRALLPRAESWALEALGQASTSGFAAAASSGRAQPIRGAAAIAAASKPAPAPHWRQHLRRAAATSAPASGAAAKEAAASSEAALALQHDLLRARQLAIPAGAAAGVVGSVAGSGGAAVIVPLISRVCRVIPQRLLAGSSMAAVLSTASISTAVFAANGCIDLPAALLIAPTAVVAAPLGARWTSRLDCDSLRRVLAYFLLAAAPLVPLKHYLFSSRLEQQAVAAAAAGGAPAGAALAAAPAALPAASALRAAAAARAAGSRDSSGSGELGWAQRLQAGMPHGPTALVLAVTGGVAGFAGGLLGIGPATLIIPVVALATPWHPAVILGTTLSAMVPTATAALLQHHRLGNVDWRLAAGLAVGSVLGGTAGSQAAVHAPPGALEAAFTAAMLFLARMTLKQMRR